MELLKAQINHVINTLHDQYRSEGKKNRKVRMRIIKAKAQTLEDVLMLISEIEAPGKVIKANEVIDNALK